jgi:hypothetical protein
MRTKGDGSNIFAVLESEGEGLVAVQWICELICGRSSGPKPLPTLPNQTQKPGCPRD